MLKLIATRTVTALAVSGAGITVLSYLGDGDAPQRGLVHATNTISHQLDTLQLTVGEGLCLDALHTVAPVLIDDLEPTASADPDSPPAPASTAPRPCSPSPCSSLGRDHFPVPEGRSRAGRRVRTHSVFFS